MNKVKNYLLQKIQSQEESTYYSTKRGETEPDMWHKLRKETQLSDFFYLGNSRDVFSLQILKWRLREPEKNATDRQANRIASQEVKAFCDVKDYGSQRPKRLPKMAYRTGKCSFVTKGDVVIALNNGISAF